jgi:hypothetical protein
MVKEISFSRDQPNFWFLNLGETHYPYMLDDASLPHISGLHGVAKSLARGEDAGGSLAVKAQAEMSIDAFFESDVMRGLHQQQIRCVEYIDGLLGALFDKAPSNTWFMIMGDHGECFGEGGFFGHGPVLHPKVFEIPFVEGLRPTRARLI